MTRPNVLYWTDSTYGEDLTGVTASWNGATDTLTCSRFIAARDWVSQDIALATETPVGRPTVEIMGIMFSYAINAPRRRVGWNTRITLGSGSTLHSMAGIATGSWVPATRWVPYDYPDPNEQYWIDAGTGGFYAQQPIVLAGPNLNGVLAASDDEGGEVTFYSHFLDPVTYDLTQDMTLSWTAASFNAYDEYDFNNAYRQTDEDHSSAYTGSSSERISRLYLIEATASVPLPNLMALPWVPRRRFGTTDEE